MVRWLAARLSRVAIAALILLALHSVAVACPTCKDAVGGQDPAHNGVAKGYYYSILFMMAAPYTIFGVFGGLMYYKVRRARAQAGTKPKRPLAGAASANRRSDVASGADIPPTNPREPVEV